MKKWIILIVPVIAIIYFGMTTLIKSESTNEEVYQKFYDKITSISYYECTANVEVRGNKTPSNYEFKHTFNSPDSYLIETILPSELKGTVVEYIGDKIIIKNSGVGDEVELPNEGEVSKNLFVGDFINNFKDSSDLIISMDDTTLVLETKIKSNSEYFDTQILFVDKKTSTPQKMVILDDEQNERFIVYYNNFKYQK